MPEITVTLTLEQLMQLPGEAVIQITEMAKPGWTFLAACQEYENRPLHGKGRWPVNNHLRQLLGEQLHMGCAACDRGDHQLGHAEGCPKG